MNPAQEPFDPKKICFRFFRGQELEERNRRHSQGRHEPARRGRTIPGNLSVSAADSGKTSSTGNDSMPAIWFKLRRRFAELAGPNRECKSGGSRIPGNKAQVKHRDRQDYMQPDVCHIVGDHAEKQAVAFHKPRTATSAYTMPERS